MPESPRPGFAQIGALTIGPDQPVRVMAILNASPESFYAGSVAADAPAIRQSAERAAEDGADLIDVGAMSTAPYKETRISEAEEADRMGMAVSTAVAAAGLPVTADTQRASVAEVALDAGACAVNDVSGLASDARMAELIASRRAGAILMANGSQLDRPADNPVGSVLRLLREALDRARSAGIPEGRIVLDPGIGFFRGQLTPWFEWDRQLIQGISEFSRLGRPLLVSPSRKSFVGRVLERPDPADRLSGTLASVLVCCCRGALVVRTHDVKDTCDAIRMQAWLSGKLTIEPQED